MTYRIYSAGISDEQKREIVEKVGLPIKRTACHWFLTSMRLKIGPHSCSSQGRCQESKRRTGLHGPKASAMQSTIGRCSLTM